MKSPIRLVSEFLFIILLCIGFLYLGGTERKTSPAVANALVKKNSSFITKPENGISVYNQALSFPGLTLIAENGSAEVKLINQLGETKHKWNVDVERARLLPNCNLLVIHGSKWGLQNEPWMHLRSKVREYSWSGEVVWEHKIPQRPHHDIQRLENGNTLVITRARVPTEYRTNITDPVRLDARILTDGIEEISPSGEIVWEWKFYETFDANRCGAGPCKPSGLTPPPGAKRVTFDWTHLNTVQPLPENKWYDSGDARFKPGNLVIIARNWSTIFILDKETKQAVWEYRGDDDYKLRSGHEAHMIPKGLAGAGNILVFNNNVNPFKKTKSGSSKIMELNPISKKPVWIYENGKEFFSEGAGSVQRLPNGNTLISEDEGYSVFEVTPNNEIVWQYNGTSRIARAQRYSYQYCSNFSALHHFSY
ncbi:MAG: aryl-sulfate sulfotransferase [Deltaproteobacteria bacterium]|nr:aryl-sulfate sulfotransferase [Deltaproteobacteria bacterium]